ncbi:MAG: LysR family transcriptional regulator [Silicimonas sp.]|nr:LysR family transcriptional regulator [Silicimonas sp.]
MTPDLLKTFVAITETGNFTAASQRVGRTQGAVSQMIKRLESELRCTLFDRKATPVKLTEHGKMLLPHAREILAANMRALSAFDQSELDGLVSLGMPEIYAEELIPRILPSFQERYPKVRIDLDLRDTTDLMRLLGAGTLDLTLATDGEVPNLTGPVVHEAPVVWIAPVGQALEARDPLPLVVWKHGSNYERIVLRTLAAANRNATVVVNTQTISGMVSSTRANMGVAAVTGGQAYGKVRVIDDPAVLPRIEPRKVHLERAYSERSPAVDLLQEHIMSVLAG